MRRTGRPKTAPPKFMDGFYLEIKGGYGSVKIRRETKEELMKAVAEYRKSKKVIILGEHKDGHWLSAPKELAPN
jgi:hypothetical protein